MLKLYVTLRTLRSNYKEVLKVPASDRNMLALSKHKVPAICSIKNAHGYDSKVYEITKDKVAVVGFMPVGDRLIDDGCLESEFENVESEEV